VTLFQRRTSSTEDIDNSTDIWDRANMDATKDTKGTSTHTSDFRINPGCTQLYAPHQLVKPRNSGLKVLFTIEWHFGHESTTSFDGRRTA